MDLVIVIILAVAIVGFLIGLVAYTTNQQSASMSEAIGQADAQIAKARQRLEIDKKAEVKKSASLRVKHP
jgi:hypothetical protein